MFYNQKIYFSFVISLVFTLSNINAEAQDQPDTTLTKEDYSIINWKITSDKQNNESFTVKNISKKLISWDSIDYFIIIPDTTIVWSQKLHNESLDTILSDSDYEYMKKQLALFIGRNQAWNKKYIKKIKLISPPQLSAIDKKNTYHQYSRPLYSKDHSIIILKSSYVCGPLCITDFVSVYKKRKDGWELVITLYGGTS